MEAVRKGKEIRVITENKVGVLSQITGYISDEGVNIEDICAYATGDQALFYLITDNNEKVKKILSEKGYNVEEKEVVILSLENRPGALSKVSARLKEEGINLHYIYGTTCDGGERTTVVFSSDNNEKAVEVLKFILSLSSWGK